jgi:cytoskeletal protein CcmA (bactofilin family)
MKKSVEAIQTLGPQMVLEGKLIFEGAVQLDGHLKGSIESEEGLIIVGEEAVIHADILVNTARVRGEVRGNIRATERIDLHPTARVFGDLNAPVVIIDAGAVFEGKCRITPKADVACKNAGVSEMRPEEKADTLGMRKYALNLLKSGELHQAFRRVISKIPR